MFFEVKVTRSPKQPLFKSSGLWDSSIPKRFDFSKLEVTNKLCFRVVGITIPKKVTSRNHLTCRVIIALCRVCMKVEVQQHDSSICVVLVVICVISHHFSNLLVRILYCLRLFGMFVLFEVIWPLATFGCVGIPKVSPETFNTPRTDTSRRILGGTKNTMVGWVVFRG